MDARNNVFSDVTIETFSYPATKLEYPAITVCKMGSYNVDEYVRTVFDNFQVVCTDNQTCADSAPLRDDYPSYLKAMIFISIIGIIYIFGFLNKCLICRMPLGIR